jgi:L-cysteine desulfidase
LVSVGFFDIKNKKNHQSNSIEAAIKIAVDEPFRLVAEGRKNSSREGGYSGVVCDAAAANCTMEYALAVSQSLSLSLPSLSLSMLLNQGASKQRY